MVVFSIFYVQRDKYMFLKIIKVTKTKGVAFD
ncbi:Uncharacterised protein [Streptococcus pneumoniae]|nr:Uncharacterised protein [Streptococcus pneumoniae]SUO09788.1 Uncharacterised protein [Streptococcus pneumoniae]VME64154.1 Uncharacterised protein [Streptococcus pneumoniae]VNK98482.1 Uncharacterised protein [Streptococcus pneumoniae]